MPKIKGYNELPQYIINHVNANKIAEERIMRTLDVMANIEAVDKRWLAISRTHIEQGFMALNRSLMKPGRIELAEDRDSLFDDRDGGFDGPTGAD